MENVKQTATEELYSLMQELDQILIEMLESLVNENQDQDSSN